MTLVILASMAGLTVSIDAADSKPPCCSHKLKYLLVLVLLGLLLPLPLPLSLTLHHLCLHLPP